MAEGWISIHRSIFENELWRDSEPFDYRSAWIDLLLLANHKDHTIISKGKLVQVKRGDVNRSLLSLAERWHWSRNKARNFLRILEELKMVTTKSTTQGTTITIENYSKFQDLLPTESTTESTTQGQRKVQRKDINNNDNNGNNDNKYISIPNNRESKKDRFQPPSIQEVKAYCLEKGYTIDPDTFWNFYESNGWKVGKNKMKDWHRAIAGWQSREKNSQGFYKPKEDKLMQAYREVLDELSTGSK